MALSRREFVRTLGRGGTASIVVSARGHEALGELWTTNAGGASAAPGQSFIQLDSNENPNGPGSKALDAIRGALPVASRYPYGEASALTTAIARLHGVQKSNVIIGCGSAEILRMSMQAFTSRTRHLVTAAPTFETPAEYAATFGVPVQAVHVDAALRLDLAAMEAKAPGAGLIYLCNPNNPTGTVLAASALGAFVERLAVAAPQTAVLVDEAYHEYVDDASYKTAVSLAAGRKNVIVSRTFSKMYGMAGLRCGYGIAHVDTIVKMSPFKLETSVNQLAIAAAIATVADKERIERERKLNRDAKEYTSRLFETMGYTVGPSETNFIMVDLRQDSRAFRDACRRAGVLVGRAFPPLNTYARISVGTMDEMQRAGATFRRVLGASAINRAARTS